LSSEVSLPDLMKEWCESKGWEFRNGLHGAMKVVDPEFFFLCYGPNYRPDPADQVDMQYAVFVRKPPFSEFIVASFDIRDPQVFGKIEEWVSVD